MARGRYVGPNVNASLIREVRMVAQQFFGHRQKPLFETVQATLKCIFCLKEGNLRPKDAITIADGQAVCSGHATKVL